MKTLLFAIVFGLLVPAVPAAPGEKHGSHAQQGRKKKVMQGPPAQFEEFKNERQRGAFRRPPGGKGTLKPRLHREPEARSLIRFPDKGPGGKPLAHQPYPPRKFDAPELRSHMALLSGKPMTRAVLRHNAAETQPERYYWHSGSGFDYCHYYDRWGYHWYGWYFGSHYFWTRYYLNRWWWYDPGFGRWTFWWGGYWYWWDPFHAGLVYVYDDGRYVEAAGETYTSGDGSRLVKILGKDRDAFLYDGGKEAAFDPIFLATGIRSVKFVETSSGRVAQLKLTLADGSTQAFTDDGEEIREGP